MIKFEKTVTPSPEQWEAIIRGMRNPKNSWRHSDSVNCLERDGCEGCPAHTCEGCVVQGVDPFVIGSNDHRLMMNLANGGPVHAKYRRMIPVYVDITAPLYWWKEFDTYKIGTVANSCSTMHKIHAEPFKLEQFSCEHLMGNVDEDTDYFTIPCVNSNSDDFYYDEYDASAIIELTVVALNHYRHLYLKTNDKRYWDKMIQLLPSSYNQKRTVQMNYEVLVGIYKWRKNHKLQEWRDMCDWIETLPYSEIITGEKNDEEKV